MFYEYNDVDDQLKCSYCATKFIDTVKLVPDCGSSICEECYREIREQVDDSSYFECRSCHGDRHLMPKNGLPDNKIAMNLLRMRPNEKPMSEKAKNLKASISELQAKIGRLRSFDPGREIHSYCDQLEREVTEAAENVIRLVDEQKMNYLKKIDLYRSELLNTSSKKVTGLKSDLANQRLNQYLARLDEDVGDFSINWTSYFNQMRITVSDAEIDRALAEANQHSFNVSQTEKRFRKNAFNKQYMSFTKYDLSNKVNTGEGVFGKLEYLDDIEKNIRKTSHQRLDQKLVHKLNGHTCYVSQIIFLNNDNIASCSWDNSIKIWDQESGELLFELTGHTNSVFSLVLLPNGDLASCSADRTIRIWDLRSKRLIKTLTGPRPWVISLVVLKNGYLASCSFDGTIKIWNPQQWDERNCLVRTIFGHGVTQWFMKLGVLSNGDLVSCSCETNQPSYIRIWNPNDGRLVHSVSTDSKCAQTLLVLSNDDIAVGFGDGRIKLINLNSISKSKTLTSCHAGGVFSLAELIDGRLMSGGSDLDSTIKIWDSNDGRLIKTIPTGHTKRVLSLTISHSGEMVASGSSDKSIKMWSLLDAN